MNNQPLVSIALPAFNAEKTVGDAIASILLQTYQNWELLFIDDGSRDQTVAIAKGFNDPRIKIFSDGTNKGLPARLNEAIDKSSGKYFARMDNDDICFPERIQKQVQYMEAHPEIDLLGVRALTFITLQRVTGLFPFRATHDAICARPWSGFYLPHPTWMGRLEWFRKHRYRTPEVKRAEDQELLLRTYPVSRFSCLPEILFAYRQRERVVLRINWTARKSLVASQLEIFYARRQWRYLLLSLLSFVLKMMTDFLRRLINSQPQHGLLNEQDSRRWEDVIKRIGSCRA